MPPRPAGEQLPFCLPSPEPNCLSLTHTAGSADLAPGDGQLVPGRPNRPAAHLVWARGGGRGGRKFRSSGCWSWKGPWSPSLQRQKHRPERAGTAPGHTAQKRLTHRTYPSVQELQTAWYPTCLPRSQACLGFSTGTQIYAQTQDAQSGNVNPATSKLGLGTALRSSEPHHHASTVG